MPMYILYLYIHIFYKLVFFGDRLKIQVNNEYNQVWGSLHPLYPPNTLPQLNMAYSNTVSQNNLYYMLRKARRNKNTDTLTTNIYMFNIICCLPRGLEVKCTTLAYKLKLPFRRLGAKGSYLTLVRVADRIL